MSAPSRSASRAAFRTPSRSASRTGRTVRSLAAPLLLLSIVLAPETAGAKCRKGECWGGIAFSRLTGYWVYSMNHPDRLSARSRAWRMCEKRCTNVATVKNGCLALFVTPKGRFAIAEGRTADEAKAAALRQCRTGRDKCRFRIARCTADFEELKRRALEKQRNRSEGHRPAAPERPPPAKVEELKL